MRVSINTIYDQIKTDLARLTGRMNVANSQISSGKIYKRPSDAPVELNFAMELRGNIADATQHMRNISYGKAWLRVSESALTQIQERLERAKTLGIQGANDSQNADTRKMIAKEIRTILEEVVALSNTKLGNRYVFAGSRTTGYELDQTPFMLDNENNVTYHGNLEKISIEVSPGIKKEINKDGFEAIEKSGVFKSLKFLYDALNANNREDIEVALAEIDKSFEYLGVQISDIGSMVNTFENRENMASSYKFTNTERLSQIEDADIVEAITELRSSETAYQASLASSARIMSMSLVDYIK